MISFRIEIDLFQAPLRQRVTRDSSDLGVRFQAELELEQVKEKRRKMRDQNAPLRSTEGSAGLQNQREGIES